MQNVGAGFHVDREADGRLAIHPVEHPRRVGVTAGDGDEIAKAIEAIVHAQIDRTQTLLGNELATDAENDPLRSGFHNAGRDNRVLRLDRAQDILLVDAKRRDLPHRKLGENDFVLRADQVHLPDVGNQQHFSPDVLDVIAQLPLSQPIR